MDTKRLGAIFSTGYEEKRGSGSASMLSMRFAKELTIGKPNFEATKRFHLFGGGAVTIHHHIYTFPSCGISAFMPEGASGFEIKCTQFHDSPRDGPTNSIYAILVLSITKSSRSIIDSPAA